MIRSLRRPSANSAPDRDVPVLVWHLARCSAGRGTAARLAAAILGLALWADQASAAIDFSKAEGLATSLASSLGGVFATAFFSIGLIVAGFLAAFNRISWLWVGLIMVGAFLVFGAPTIVADLRSSLG